mmetsp:Transcript_19386/g.32241  ORF Transcript_19386/g.32241 Transcript_19386/m.32241 type:complete len:413 (-) Transcript_19386:61-1299(-)
MEGSWMLVSAKSSVEGSPVPKTKDTFVFTKSDSVLLPHSLQKAFYNKTGTEVVLPNGNRVGHKAATLKLSTVPFPSNFPMIVAFKSANIVVIFGGIFGSKQKDQRNGIVSESFFKKMAEALNADAILSADNRVSALLKKFLKNAAYTNIGSTGKNVDSLAEWMSRVIVNVDKGTVAFERTDSFPLLTGQHHLPAIPRTMVTRANDSSQGTSIPVPSVDSPPLNGAFGVPPQPWTIIGPLQNRRGNYLHEQIVSTLDQWEDRAAESHHLVSFNDNPHVVVLAYDRLHPLQLCPTARKMASDEETRTVNQNSNSPDSSRAADSSDEDEDIAPPPKRQKKTQAPKQAVANSFRAPRSVDKLVSSNVTATESSSSTSTQIPIHGVFYMDSVSFNAAVGKASAKFINSNFDDGANRC